MFSTLIFVARIPVCMCMCMCVCKSVYFVFVWWQICVCDIIHTHTWICVCDIIYTHTWIYKNVSVCVCLNRPPPYMHACVYACVFMHACMRACVRVCVRTYMQKSHHIPKKCMGACRMKLTVSDKPLRHGLELLLLLVQSQRSRCYWVATYTSPYFPTATFSSS